ncbi:hypothetical protein Sango_2331100 [Sesamum angolense]|uniref:Reverse transcriptase/retrotransposon-derived protein RNase H-like domain-containing protein n=1 Tax=Sesamum angolense TaxID=2727404 RepID=A0AAE1WB76_9LAMI|nr:hypothetical protein Sango_2331100 [Sesamum angolense]
MGKKRNAYIDSGSGICTAKPGVFPKEARETLPVIAGRDFSQKNPNTQYGNSRSKIMIGGAFGTPWFRVKTPPIYFHDTGADILLDKRKFDKVLLSFRQQGLIDSDSFTRNLRKKFRTSGSLEELKTMDISEESKLSLENVKRLIQRNFSENPLAWWDRNKIEATLRSKKECKYDSPGFLVRNHGEIKRGIFIKDLAKYRKDFRPLKETESAKWKWEEIHTQRVRELKQVCNNLPKLAIPQDEDELVVYTDANDYRWAAVLMKKTTTGEEPCRYTGGLFTEQQAKMWHINEKEFFAVWKAFKK